MYIFRMPSLPAKTRSPQLKTF